MNRPLRDLSEFPLRDHGAPERVDRIWRRLSPELSPERVSRKRVSPWGPALLVAAFGAGVFVGAGWQKPEATPTLSAERATVPEPVAGPAQPPPGRTEVATDVEPKRPAPKTRSVGVTSPEPPLALLPVGPAEPVIEMKMAPESGPPEWERLADTGDLEAARKALESAGGFDAAVSAASASQLMTLVDIARASGGREQAISALRRVVDAFRQAPEAPLAAWTLGNLLDQAGDEAGAAEVFALYRRLSPGGDFAEDALAHEVVRAFARADLELSARLVAQYENEFPNGARLEEFRAELAKRSARAAGIEAPATTDPESATATPEDDVEPAEAPGSSKAPTK